MNMKPCFVFMSSLDWDEARAGLLTEDDLENAGAFLCGVSESSLFTRLLVRRFVPVPSALYTERMPYHLEISPAFYNSIVSQCEKENLHPVIVHSHPKHETARYSP